jgi:hypothetical protein
MNNSKWTKILPYLVDHKIKVKVKLTYHEQEGDEVVIGHDGKGGNFYLKWDHIISPSANIYECPSIGPFKSSEIDWLKMSLIDFQALSKNFEMQLETETKNDVVRIFSSKE